MGDQTIPYRRKGQFLDETIQMPHAVCKHLDDLQCHLRMLYAKPAKQFSYNPHQDRGSRGLGGRPAAVDIHGSERR